MGRFKEIWDYREMIISLVKRDLKSKYKGSVLGFFWMILNPLLQLCVYTIVFSVIMRMDIDKYYLFMFVAFIPWLFFSTCLSGGTGAVFNQQDMVKKIYFPREVLPISFAISQFVNMLLSFVVVFAAVFISGITISLQALLCLPVIMIIEFILCLGITYITSALDVYFRDMGYMMNIVAMALVYLTPVFYSETMVPEKFRSLFYLNPMTSITIAYRDILYYGRMPQLRDLRLATLIGIVVLILGHVIFWKLQKHFIEEL